MAPIEKNLLRQAKRFGEPIPDRIRNKPRLGMGLDIFLDAFFDLEHERTFLVGAAIQALPIPWQSINKYAEVHELTGDLYDDMLYFIRALDDAYLKHVNKKA